MTGNMTVRLYSNPPPLNSSRNAVASGYTRGGLAQSYPAQVRSMPVNQPLPHPAWCYCPACMPGQPAATASQPPAYRPPTYRPQKPRTSWGARGMDGFDGAELVAGTALGYRWWTLSAPQLYLSPADASRNWEPGLLRGVKDVWYPGVNQARCLAQVRHPFEEIPHDSCADGFWAYWEIQPHDLGGVNSLPVVGVIRASGQVIMGPRGFRAQQAEIVALHLPFRIQPDLPALQPPRQPDYQTRALPGSSRTMTHRRFTGKVINYGGGYVPAPFRDDPPPPAPGPPTDEEIQAAKDLAEAWEAVIADRLAVTYPGAEVCATLGLMKAKYPVRSEYAPPQGQVMIMLCPYCSEQCETADIHAHMTEKHRY